MATLDELQAQLTALAQRVNEITAPPDDYYTHRFSGEEIDNAVGRVAATAGSGAITAGDVGAAPDGYGLGANRLPVIDNSAFSSLLPAGFYLYNDQEHPIGSSQIGLLLSLGRNTSYAGLSTQIFTIFGSVLVRNPTLDNYNPEWDWLNPPMQLGVEYRTTERYNGKPVYAFAMNLGQGPAQGETKKVSHNIENISHIVSYGGDITANGTQALSVPFDFDPARTSKGVLNADFKSFTLVAVNTGLTGYTECYAWMKYTKTTD